MTNPLSYTLERTIVIGAKRTTVFRYFTDSERFARWWGTGSSIEARPKGLVRIRYPNGVIASGQVLEIADGERIVFTYGYEQPTGPIPPGGSKVTITLQNDPEGTRLSLYHELPSALVRDQHVQGWRYQMAVFANIVSREAHAEVREIVERYLALWGEPDDPVRREKLALLVTDDVSVRDAFTCTSGLTDLCEHMKAAQAHMPGVRLIRRGDVRYCQGSALVDWDAEGPDGQRKGAGSSLFDLSGEGRIRRVIGFWEQ